MTFPILLLYTQTNDKGSSFNHDEDDDDNDDGLLSVQVKKAVGGSIRGMALYEDDVRPSHRSHHCALVNIHI